VDREERDLGSVKYFSVDPTKLCKACQK
jgi:hypothetical protein